MPNLSNVPGDTPNNLYVYVATVKTTKGHKQPHLVISHEPTTKADFINMNELADGDVVVSFRTLKYHTAHMDRGLIIRP